MNSNALFSAAKAGIPSILGILCIAAVIYWIGAKKPLLNKLGSCLLPFPRKKSIPFIAALACIPLLFALLFFRDFGGLLNIVLGLSGGLCVHMAMQDIIYRSISGVYEKGICADGKLLWYSDIEAIIPLPDTNTEGSSLLQLTVKNGIVSMRLESPEEREKTIQIMKSFI
ncbi:MAG: hypothetical protein LBU99_04945 [Spirochaetaceae bacterium]|jgi:hypothetical protein|nr:hypothetical protein [Spirochaetaceae bacterium]